MVNLEELTADDGRPISKQYPLIRLSNENIVLMPSLKYLRLTDHIRVDWSSPCFHGLIELDLTCIHITCWPDACEVIHLLSNTHNLRTLHLDQAIYSFCPGYPHKRQRVVLPRLKQMFVEHDNIKTLEEFLLAMT
jgi:hypothetical protein